MTNEELQQLRALCGQPRFQQGNKSRMLESNIDETVIAEMAEFYRDMGLSVTRAKLVELIEARKSKCPCCGDKAKCKCSPNCAKCDCNAVDEDEECDSCELVDVCTDCKKELDDCTCEDTECCD